MEGYGKETLFEAVRKLDQSLIIDSVLKKKNSLCLTCDRDKGTVTRWRIRFPLDNYQEPETIFKGTGLKGLEQALKKAEETVTVVNGIHVLCLKKMDPAKTWKGEYRTEWWDIDPDMPYRITDDGILIDTLVFFFTESEFKACMATEMAFYDPEKKIIYPLTRQSLVSVGRFLDGGVAFKQLDEHMLPSALLVAEKIMSANPFNIMCRKVTHRVRNVMSLSTARFVQKKQLDFFSELFDNVAGLGIYDVGKWDITANLTTVDIEMIMPFVSEWRIMLHVVFPELPGMAATLAVVVVREGLRLSVGVNSLPRVSSFDTAKLLTGVEDVIKDTGSKLLKLESIILENLTVDKVNEVYSKLYEIAEFLPVKIRKHLILPVIGGVAADWYFENMKNMLPYVKDYNMTKAGEKACELMDILSEMK